MTSRSCAAAMSKPPAAAISTTATYSPTWRVKTESMSSKQRERGENQDSGLCDGDVAARREQERASAVVAQDALPCELTAAHRATPQPATPSRDGDGDAGLEGGFAQEAEIDDEHEQRGDFEGRFRQRGAEEVVDVVHCPPPASRAFTAGSMVSRRMRG